MTKKSEDILKRLIVAAQQDEKYLEPLYMVEFVVNEAALDILAEVEKRDPIKPIYFRQWLQAAFELPDGTETKPERKSFIKSLFKKKTKESPGGENIMAEEKKPKDEKKEEEEAEEGTEEKEEEAEDEEETEDEEEAEESPAEN